MTEHLDADELSAFAEGSIPAAARTRYVSHLVDCDDCRQIVSQLAISSGAVAAESSTAVEPSGYSWSKKLAQFLSPMTLRYAAFAMVLITVAGVVFLVMRRPRESRLIAQNQSSQPATAVKPSGDATSPTVGTTRLESNNNTLATRPTPPAQASPADQLAKLDQPRPADTLVVPPKPAKEPEVTTSGAQKKAESAETQTVPGYSPPPPPVLAQRTQTQTREQQSTGGAAPLSGPRKSEEQFGMMSKSGRAGEENKDNVLADRPAPASRRGSDEKLKGPRRDMDNSAALNRNADDARARNTQGIATQNQAQEEKPTETRAAGGRKFRRQGSGWVDAKFKPSMPLKSVARGSSEFNELDSGLRSIAQQLGGQVIVVWKNKAYLIK